GPVEELVRGMHRDTLQPGCRETTEWRSRHGAERASGWVDPKPRNRVVTDVSHVREVATWVDRDREGTSARGDRVGRGNWRERANVGSALADGKSGDAIASGAKLVRRIEELASWIRRDGSNTGPRVWEGRTANRGQRSVCTD